MAMREIKGVLCPAISTFKENGDLDFTAFEKNIQMWNEYPLEGYVVFGPTAEAVLLTEQEKTATLKACVGSAAEEKRILVSSGCESTRATLELTNKCARLGADAALISPPSFYRNRMSRKAIYEHYILIASESEMPVILYNDPFNTGINMEPDLIAELSVHKNIVGVQDNSSSIAQIGEILSLVAEDFTVLGGTANIFFSGYMMGMQGGIQALASFCPAECTELYFLCKEGKYAQAAALQKRLIPLNKAITTIYGLAGLKAIMEMKGFSGGYPRRPLLPMSDEEKAELRKIASKAGLL